MLQLSRAPLAGDIRQAMRGGSALSAAPPAGIARQAESLAQAFGGRANLTHIEVRGSRMSITLGDARAVDEPAVEKAGFRGAVKVAPGTWHVIAGPAAEEAAALLRRG